jgi:homoserine/homoserine lactone efflux protein
VNSRLWLAYAALEIGLSLTPGPAVLTVASQGLRHGWRRSVYGALGISAGNLVFFALSALGIGAFLATSPRVYAVLRWGGIAYLAWSAARLLASRAATLGRVAAADGRPRALFAQAVATQLSNPKAIVFFASFLAPFVDPGAAWSVPAQLAAFAATTAVCETPILAFYGWVASRGGALLPEGKLGQWQDRIAGACLLVVAAWLGLRG